MVLAVVHTWYSTTCASSVLIGLFASTQEMGLCSTVGRGVMLSSASSRWTGWAWSRPVHEEAAG
jgi:hypothetical protein